MSCGSAQTLLVRRLQVAQFLQASDDRQAAAFWAHACPDITEPAFASVHAFQLLDERSDSVLNAVCEWLAAQLRETCCCDEGACALRACGAIAQLPPGRSQLALWVGYNCNSPDARSPKETFSFPSSCAGQTSPSVSRATTSCGIYATQFSCLRARCARCQHRRLA